MCHLACVVTEERLHGPVAVLLGGCEKLEGARPVPLVRPHRDCIVIGTARDEEARMPAAARVGPEQRSCRADLGVEAGIAGRPYAVPRLRVEDDDDLVARGVFQLLDHQLLAAGGRRPVHPAQRFAALVLADAVKLETGGPPEEDPPTAVRTEPALREERGQASEPGIDEQRCRVLERLDLARKSEGILDDGPGTREAVAAARDPREAVNGAQETAVAVDDHVALTEPADRIPEDDARRNHAAFG